MAETFSFEILEDMKHNIQKHFSLRKYVKLDKDCALLLVANMSSFHKNASQLHQAGFKSRGARDTVSQS